MAGTAITRITGSKDLYPEHRGDSASVNFVTCHDGFTLYDLYAYNTKHNEKNGWNNSDGDNNGNSWNCGAEGETDDPQIEGLRLRMVKNACATLMCSRGPAMFYAGDEFCNTQFGNNNAYCQDNIISWLDWTRLEKYQEIHDFFRYMIAFREKYPILRRSTKKALCGLPEISIHNGFPWNGGTDYTSKLIGIMYAGRDDADTRDDIIFYGMNAYWETLVMQLPELPNNLQWKICVNTNIEYEDGKDVEAQTEFYYKKTLKVPPSSVGHKNAAGYSHPPSNVMICPVRYSFPVASCTARWAVSSGVPNLPAGISSASSARSSSEKQAFICVSMTPQAIALTWILLGASSFASAFVKELMPPLHAE